MILHRYPFTTKGSPVMSRYRKALVAAAIATLIGLVQLTQSLYFDGEWTTEDTFTLVLAALGALGVYTTRNVIPEGAEHDPTISEAEFTPDPAHDEGHVDVGVVLVAFAAAVVTIVVWSLIR